MPLKLFLPLALGKRAKKKSRPDHDAKAIDYRKDL
jgi:hypothetical protein